MLTSFWSLSVNSSIKKKQPSIANSKFPEDFFGTGTAGASDTLGHEIKSAKRLKRRKQMFASPESNYLGSNLRVDDTKNKFVNV